MLNPLIHLINNIVSIINLGLIVWIVLDILMRFDIINRRHPLVQRIHGGLGALFEPMLRPIRRLLSKLLPSMGGFDISPIVLILLLNFFADAMYQWFYTL